MSVLFADLVGFTTLSEHRDPEEVRELLSEYFERCRTLIERYGGTVEKFIGDAVMAVWGTPVAREDDAERAVRAALVSDPGGDAAGRGGGDARAAGSRWGADRRQPRSRSGAEGEGMVLGDTRQHRVAAAVDRRARHGARRRRDAARVARRRSPTRTPVSIRSRVASSPCGPGRRCGSWPARGGARRGAGLEAPFVGRDRELQTVIEAFETAASERRARLVTVVGEAGTGKSRLLWEYFKYIDGVERLVSWHQGRCLSYGDGVAYWALAEMVRARAGIAEEESA